MKGTFFDNAEIKLYLKREEFNHAYLSRFETEKDKSLVCKLKKMNGSDSGRNINLQYEDFESMSDGIKVKYKKETFFVKINEHGINSLDKQGYLAARYGNSQGITIYIPERCNIYNNLYS